MPQYIYSSSSKQDTVGIYIIIGFVSFILLFSLGIVIYQWFLIKKEKDRVEESVEMEEAIKLGHRIAFPKLKKKLEFVF